MSSTARSWTWDWLSTTWYAVGVSTATVYRLWVGTAPGGNNLFSRQVGTALSATVGGLPINGRTVYVRLWSQINGAWQFNDYTYRSGP